MCDRTTILTDPTADFVLSDLLAVTEDLIDFSINVFDTVRLQSHFNERNRRISLGMQLKNAYDVQKFEHDTIDTSNKPCVLSSTLKYDLTLYLGRILQACKRTKANLMLLRVSRIRGTNTTLLLFASTKVRLEHLHRKIQLLTRLVKENGGLFQIKKKKKKSQTEVKVEENVESKHDITEQNPEVKQKHKKKKPLTTMSKEDLDNYVEIAHSFHTIITKYYEFIQHIRYSGKSYVSSSGQTSISNSIVLVPIASNTISELNSILNHLMDIIFKIEIESNSVRQPQPLPMKSAVVDIKELYQRNTREEIKEEPSANAVESKSQTLITDRVRSSRVLSSRIIEDLPVQKENNLKQYGNESSSKQNGMLLLKQNDNRSNIRNQSAIPSAPTILTTTLNTNPFTLTPNMIANIFEDVFSIDDDALYD